MTDPIPSKQPSPIVMEELAHLMNQKGVPQDNVVGVAFSSLSDGKRVGWRCTVRYRRYQGGALKQATFTVVEKEDE